MSRTPTWDQPKPTGPSWEASAPSRSTPSWDQPKPTGPSWDKKPVAKPQVLPPPKKPDKKLDLAIPKTGFSTVLPDTEKQIAGEFHDVGGLPMFSLRGAVGSAAAEFVTGFPAYIAYVGALGLRSMGLNVGSPEKISAKINRAIRYQPRTYGGRIIARAVGVPFSAVLGAGRRLINAGLNPTTDPKLNAAARFAMNLAVFLIPGSKLKGGVEGAAMDSLANEAVRTGAITAEDAAATVELAKGVTKDPTVDPVSPDYYQKVVDENAQSYGGRMKAWRTSLRKSFRGQFPDFSIKEARLTRALIKKVTFKTQMDYNALMNGEAGRGRLFREMGDGEGLRYMDEISAGKRPVLIDPHGNPVEFGPVADIQSGILDTLKQWENDAGIPTEEYKNYFPSFFDNPAAITEWVNREPAGAALPGTKTGTPGFLLHRYFRKVTDAMEKTGVRLKSYNPSDLMQMRAIDSMRTIIRVRAIKELEKVGLVHHGEAIGEETQFNDPISGQFAVAPSVVPLLKNRFYGPSSLWSDPSIMGKIFQGANEVKMFTLPLMLFGLFHPAHLIFFVNAASAMAESAMALGKEGFDASRMMDIRGLGRNIKDKVLSPSINVGKLKKVVEGSLKREDLNEAENQSLGLLEDGGPKLGAPPQFTSGAKDNFLRAVQEHKYGKATLWLTPAAVRELQAPIFNYLVPRLKVHAYLNAAMLTLKHHPELAINNMDRYIALDKIGESIDQRFGEMALDDLFWPRRLTEGLQTFFLSFSWNYGGVKQFGGAFRDLSGLVFKGIPHDVIERLAPGHDGRILKLVKRVLGDKKASEYVSSRLLYTLAYHTNAVLVSGMMQWGMTGKAPSGLYDLWNPIVGTDINGNPTRAHLPNWLSSEANLVKYTREKGILPGTLEEVANKSSPVISDAVRWFANKNYYGTLYSDPMNPEYQQLFDKFVGVFGSSIVPFSLQAMEQPGFQSIADKVLAIFGSRPVPGVELGFAEKIHTIYKLLHPSVKTPQQALKENLFYRMDLLWEHNRPQFMEELPTLAIQMRWNRKKVLKYVKSMEDPRFSSELKELPVAIQKRLLNEAPPGERDLYSRYLGRQDLRKIRMMQ